MVSFIFVKKFFFQIFRCYDKVNANKHYFNHFYDSSDLSNK